MSRKIYAALLVVILSCFMPALFSGCANKDSNVFEDDGKIHIITTLFAPYDFAKNIVQEEADVHMLLAPGEESHSFDPTPQDIINIQQCDLFIYNGGESEEWVESILSDIPPSVKIVKMMDCDFAKFEEEGEDEFDEHVWASPANAVVITEAIEAALEEVASDAGEKDVGVQDESGDRAGLGDIFKRNADTYISKLEKLDDDIKDVVSHSKRSTLVFGDRFPMRYFTEEFGLDYYAAFPGCSADVEASPSTIVKLVDTVRDNNIPVVLKMELSSGKNAEAIAEETGTEVETFYVCHNVSKEDFDNGVGYLDLMERNLTVLKKALN